MRTIFVAILTFRQLKILVIISNFGTPELKSYSRITSKGQYLKTSLNWSRLTWGLALKLHSHYCYFEEREDKTSKKRVCTSNLNRRRSKFHLPINWLIARIRMVLRISALPWVFTIVSGKSSKPGVFHSSSMHHIAKGSLWLWGRKADPNSKWKFPFSLRTDQIVVAAKLGSFSTWCGSHP